MVQRSTSSEPAEVSTVSKTNKSILESQIRELEDQLFDICFQRNVAEAKLSSLTYKIKRGKKLGLIDAEYDLDDMEAELA
jgi:hypothetical protein